jgi:peptidoglycan/LPS O-acetylase OafA/YrhL
MSTDKIDTIMNYSKDSADYIPEFDGIRGISILIVMIFHAKAPFLKGGYIGVDIFFVLSGFLITFILLNEYNKTDRIDLRLFYVKRVLRLAPALIFLLVFINLYSQIYLDNSAAKSTFIDSIIVLFYSVNWSRAFGIHSPYYLAHCWSLSIEEQFYFIWPIIFLVILRNIKSKTKVLYIVLFVAFTIWFYRIYLIYGNATIMRLYNGLDSRADALLIGCSLALFISNNEIGTKKIAFLGLLLKYLAPISLLFIVLICLLVHWKNINMYYWGFFVVELCSAVLILNVYICKNSIINVVLRTRLLTLVGCISYGLYLYHYPIYKVMAEVGYSWKQVMSFGTIATFAIAILSYYLIEKPALRLKRKYVLSVQ